MLFDLKAWLILALGVIAIANGAYWLGRWNGSAACDERHESAALADYKKRTEDAEKKSSELEAKLGQARQYAEKMERLVQYEIGKNDVYRTCVMPADGVRLLNHAITGDTPR